MNRLASAFMALTILAAPAAADALDTPKAGPSDPRIKVIDYKDTALLRKFISDRGKIRARRVTGVTVQQQREIAKAVKNAREVALLPYTSTARWQVFLQVAGLWSCPRPRLGQPRSCRCRSFPS